MLWNFDPILFSLFGYEIRWYGLCFALGFVVGRTIMRHIFLRENKDPQLVDSILLYVFVSVVVGARLGHVLFYDPMHYLENPIKIFYLREGGLASHGSAIGILIGMALYARKTKMPYLYLLDRLVIGIALAGAFIRIGNFMNSEIYGRPTNAKTGIIFARTANDLLQYNLQAEQIEFKTLSNTDSIRLQVTYHGELPLDKTHQYTTPVLAHIFRHSEASKHLEWSPNSAKRARAYHHNHMTHLETTLAPIKRHPTQLYESLFALALSIMLFVWWRAQKHHLRHGSLFAAFLVLLWGFRFLIEFLKVPQEHFAPIGGLNMGQWLSIPFFVSGIVIWIWIQSKKKATF